MNNQIKIQQVKQSPATDGPRVQYANRHCQTLRQLYYELRSSSIDFQITQLFTMHLTLKFVLKIVLDLGLFLSVVSLTFIQVLACLLYEIPHVYSILLYKLLIIIIIPPKYFT